MINASGKMLLEKDITAHIGTTKYLVSVGWRNGTLIMDEPTSIQGNDVGPDPYTTLLASLAGCTLSTMRMYADRKGWDVPEMKVSLNMYQTLNPFSTTIQRAIELPATLPEEQRERLLQIAQKCPVSKILENNVTINTTI